MDAAAVLDYWFGSDADDAVVARNKGGMWWNSTPAIDDDMRNVRCEPSAALACAVEIGISCAAPEHGEDAIGV